MNSRPSAFTSEQDTGVAWAPGSCRPFPELCLIAQLLPVQIGRRSPVMPGQALDLQEAGNSCAFGGIGEAHLHDHALAQGTAPAPTSALPHDSRDPGGSEIARREVPRKSCSSLAVARAGAIFDALTPATVTSPER